jgi:hypothetical protein
MLCSGRYDQPRFKNIYTGSDTSSRGNEAARGSWRALGALCMSASTPTLGSQGTEVWVHEHSIKQHLFTARVVAGD